MFVAVYQIPVLGPILGPILYDIKCIVDDILNVGEVVLDGLLNDLQPELKGLSGNYLTSVCRMLDQNILGAQSQLILAPLSPVNLILSTILYICYKLSLCRQEQCLLY